MVVLRDPMSFSTLSVILVSTAFAYSAWLTSIVFCAAHNMRPLMITSAALFPVGVVHGLGVWFGGW